MTPGAFLREARRLARPCAYLRVNGTQYAGVWGGRGVVPAPRKSLEHRLSVDLAKVPELGATGCLSVYVSDDGVGSVVHDPRAALPSKPDGEKLFAHTDMSLPPIDAVFLKGSSAVELWLEANDWEREAPYNDNFRDRQVTDAYERAYQAQSPLYVGNAVAVLGGWNTPWPDGDFAEYIDSPLVVWTFRDSEPWLEVWRSGAEYRVISRIT